jgi:paraquat-inducible protein B
VPVTVSVDPARYGVKFLNLPDSENASKNNQAVMNAMVAHGLRAQLKTGNLISGSLYVAVDLVSNAPPATLDWSQSPVQLPTLSGKLEGIEDSVASLLKNLDKTVVDARGTLTNADRLLDNAGTLLAPDSVLNSELNNLLMQGGGAARSLRVLADYLERHPEALIHGKTGEAK